jgi:DNA-directed RNA polymerase subunit N (RpoN/RPB10)
MGENENLEAMKCTACGGDIVKSYRTVDEDEEIPIAQCLSCGNEYDQYSEEYYRYFADDFTYDAENSVLELGLKGTLEGVEYEIIGRIRMQEEEESEKSTWDEWFAVSSDGGYHFFVEEEGEIHSYEEYVPESINLDTGSDYIEFEGKKIDKDEAYIGRVVFFEGELPWEVDIGEAFTCYDFKKGGEKYTIEQSENEVSITKGDKLSYKEIIAAFGKEEDKILYDNTMKRRSEYKKKSYVYLLGFLLTLAFTIYSCGQSKKISGLMESRQVLTNNKQIVEKRSRSFFSQVLYGPITIPEGENLYEADLQVDESVHRFHLEWQSFRFMMVSEERLNKVLNNSKDPALLRSLFSEIDAQKEPVESYVVTGDFWDEQGYDSDGRWHESDLNVSADFVLNEPGRYFGYLELYSNKRRRIESVVVSISQVKSVRYLIIVMVLMSVLMIVNRSMAKSYNELPFEISGE